MTYQEAADFLGVKVESARRRAQRDGWPRQSGNDGRTRVGIPGDIAAGSGASGATDAGDDHPHPGEVEALREALVRERERADRAEALVATERDRAVAAEQAQAEARERAARLEGELDGVKLGTEHLHDQLTQATRQRDEALSLLLERKAAADAERKAREEAEATLAKLRGRGLLARLRNRP
jgi:hypothetical protein